MNPINLVEERYLERFPRYPDRRVFRIRCIGNPGLVAECSEVAHEQHDWRLVRLSTEGGPLSRAHLEMARWTFFAEEAEVHTEQNPSTGRIRLSQKLESRDEAASSEGDEAAAAEPGPKVVVPAPQVEMHLEG